ncbi:bifunctional glutamine synthetase adenylyltransferase/deadenyltransferase [Endozoicomonas sp. (ex Bugula neritina AB1)]|nr:bifunctional glutamine synthetase adenylyltransferase/deadenyltransferase [Endozoicomonas sp. (ex Bugula neritina AB1)]
MESFKALFNQRLDQLLVSDTIHQTLQAQWQQFSSRNPHFNPQVGSDFIDELFTCWLGSDFAAEQCMHRPELLLKAATEQELPSHANALAASLENVSTEDDLIKALRLYRNEQMVRIIWRDLNRKASMQQTTTDLSDMADACVEQAMQWLYEDLQPVMGTPYGGQSDDELKSLKMIVLGMGKLGAQELNLSSDIDLMFAYPYQGETRGGRRTVTNQEFFIRLGQRLIKVLDCQTADGFVFRVDMRLRPYGSSGALAMSFSAMEQYYQDQGRDWERYAMIKARVMAGDMEAGYALLSNLRPFVYRRYIDFGAIDALRDMKRMIQREVKRKGMESNIKLGPGGIREIEFIAQSFQLIHGGRDRSLQQKSLLGVLDTLGNEHYITSETAAELTSAYIYLRNLEHSFQAMSDRQTQNLPDNQQIQSRIAQAMGYSHWDDLLIVLNEHRDLVSKHFDAVISDPDDQAVSEENHEYWQSLWLGRMSEEEELNLFEQEGFQEPQKSLRQLSSLRSGRAIARVRRQSRERLDSFMPLLLKVAASSSFPDISLLRLLPLVEAVLRRTAYLVLLMENPAALEHLCKLCTVSPWVADQIARNPVLLDEFLNLGDLYHPPQRQQLADELRQQLAHIPEDDLEAQMEALRYFRMAHVLRVVAAQVTGNLPLMKESDYLTWIAEVVLEQVVSIAWRNLTERHGAPKDADGNLCHPGFIVIGYGKLGGIELGPGSDLDLVFVHDGALNKETDGSRAIDSTTFYTRLGQRIIHILNTQTASGALYETDMRLRPSGSSGLLVSSFKAFEKYQKDDAWTWEHQALVRARVVAGDRLLARKFEKVRAGILSTRRDTEQLQQDVCNMRQKMRKHLGSKSTDSAQFHLKHDRGGIVDIEFLMQYAVLRYACDYPSLLKWTDNIRISEELEKVHILDKKEAHYLREAYKVFRLSIHQRALQNKSSLAPVAEFERLRDEVADLWKKKMNSYGLSE